MLPPLAIRDCRSERLRCIFPSSASRFPPSPARTRLIGHELGTVLVWSFSAGKRATAADFLRPELARLRATTTCRIGSGMPHTFLAVYHFPAFLCYLFAIC